MAGDPVPGRHAALHDPQSRRSVGRGLKDRTGLSLAALGARLTPTDAERFGVRWELAVQVWPRPPARVPVSGPRQQGGVYEEEVPTLPWCVESASESDSECAGDSFRRVLFVAVLLVPALGLLAVVVGAVAFG